MIRAIIFDFDGVILESLNVKGDAFRYLFRDYPQFIDAIVKFHYEHGGMSRFEKFDWVFNNLLKRPIEREEKERLNKGFSSYVYNKLLECPFVDGVLDFLEDYYRKIDFFVISSAPFEELSDIIVKKGLNKFFKQIYGFGLQKTQRIKDILERYKLNSAEIIFIGDALDDYRAASQAGVRFIARMHNKNKHIFERQPVKSINNFKKLRAIIDKENSN